MWLGGCSHLVWLIGRVCHIISLIIHHYFLMECMFNYYVDEIIELTIASIIIIITHEITLHGVHLY